MKRKMKQTRDESPGIAKEKRPQDWRVEEQLQALHESYGLTGEALNAWCRERGLFAHHLTSWKAAFCSVQTNAELASPSKRELRYLNLKLYLS
jgi:hypothetical protein